eukprot:gb/GEZN01000766.1/.p1 GENE.gb/GEZN01000766.1/~~gb/GEZN01000766.1/.p1  ORF type:complete len:1086 (+),score=177.49 gb/GEZN01000766.1/:358-3615(+)
MSEVTGDQLPMTTASNSKDAAALDSGQDFPCAKAPPSQIDTVSPPSGDSTQSELLAIPASPHQSAPESPSDSTPMVCDTSDTSAPMTCDTPTTPAPTSAPVFASTFPEPTEMSIGSPESVSSTSDAPDVTFSPLPPSITSTTRSDSLLSSADALTTGISSATPSDAPSSQPFPQLRVNTPETPSFKRPVSALSPLSARKSKRTRVQTPKAEAASQLQIQGFRQLNSPDDRSDMIPGVLVMAPIQARSMNRKLPKGYKLVPLHASMPPPVVVVKPAIVAMSPEPTSESLAEKRQRKQSFRVLDLDPELSSPVVSTPKPKPRPHTPHAPPPTPIEPPVHTPTGRKEKDDKSNRLDLLQKKLDLLKQRAAMMTTPVTPIQPSSRGRAGAGARSGGATLGRKRKSLTSTPPTPSPVYHPKPAPTPVFHAKTPPEPMVTSKLPLSPSPIPRLEPDVTPHFPASFDAASAGQVTPASRRSRQIKKPAHLSDSHRHSVTLTEPFRRCRDLLLQLMKQPFGHIFSEPVDWQKLQIPDYPRIVKHPMDLGTIRTRLTEGVYLTLDNFASDVRLVWSNACTYNKPATFIYQRAQEYSALFEKKYLRIETLATAPRVPRKPSAIGGVSSVSKSGRKKKGESATGLEAKVADMEEKMLQMHKLLEQRGGANKKKTDEVPLTRHEKKLLKEDICKLPASSLQPVINMIREASPNAQQGDSIVIDIDKLDTSTLRNLQRHVKRTLNTLKRTKSKKKPTPSRAYQSSTPVSSRSILTSPAPGNGVGHSMINSPPQLDYSGQTPQMSPMKVQAEGPDALPAKPVKSDSSDGSSSSSDSDSDSESEPDPAKLAAQHSQFASKEPFKQPQSKEAQSPAATEGVPAVASGSDASPDVMDTLDEPPPSSKQSSSSSLSLHRPPPSSSSPAHPAFGDPDNTLYATTLPDASPTLKAVAGAKASEGEDNPEADVDTGVWSTLATDSAAAVASTWEKSDDSTWSNFQSQNQDQRQKQRERLEQEERAREEQVRKTEERRRQLEAEHQIERKRLQEEEARRAEEAARQRAAAEAEIAELRAAEERARLEQLEGGLAFENSGADLEAEMI